MKNYQKLNYHNYYAQNSNLKRVLSFIDTLSLKQDDVQKLDRQIIAQRAEIERIDRMAFTLYESLQSGVISEDEYRTYKARYNTLRDEAELAVNNLSREKVRIPSKHRLS